MIYKSGPSGLPRGALELILYEVDSVFPCFPTNSAMLSMIAYHVTVVVGFPLV